MVYYALVSVNVNIPQVNETDRLDPRAVLKINSSFSQLVKAIKDLETRIEKLDQEIKQLKS